MSQRTYHDPLHRGIGLDRQAPAEGMVMDLVDTAPFQRLRRIRQLGPAYLTFHSAESGFCVLRIKARGHRELVTVVGALPGVRRFFSAAHGDRELEETLRVLDASCRAMSKEPIPA